MFIINWAGLTLPPGAGLRVKVNSKASTASKQKSAANQSSEMNRDKGTRRQGEGGTRRQGALISLSPCLLVSLSPLLLVLLLAFSTATTGGQPAAIRFTDITAQSGITFRHVASPEKKYLVESMSGGLAAFDYDNDGYLDIYFVNSLNVDLMKSGGKTRSLLYRNNGEIGRAHV